jgi:hypothetical protein
VKSLMSADSGTITLEEWKRLNREDVAELIEAEYGEVGGTDPLEAEYGPGGSR